MAASNIDYDITKKNLNMNWSNDIQKQPSEMFYEKSCSLKYRNIRRKTIALDLIRLCLKATLLKRDSNTGIFMLILRNF